MCSWFQNRVIGPIIGPTVVGMVLFDGLWLVRIPVSFGAAES